MYAYGLVLLIVLVGIVVQVAVSYATAAKFPLSRFWYLTLGLVLILPTTDYPVNLVREIADPNPRIQTFNLPLTVAWALGLYLVVRFFTTRPIGKQNAPA